MSLTPTDIAIQVHLMRSIDEVTRENLLNRLFAECEQGLSPELINDLIQIFEKEANYLKNDFIPAEEEMLYESENDYKKELDRIQPNLQELVYEYKTETENLMHECKIEYLKLDKELDEIAQNHLKSKEEAEIEAIHQQLAIKKQS
ncbi:MAG: hypothetical protein UT55_C0001G0025 [Candidatus Peregrinibacteria bacterium GW2011_GWE2_39_6]|nr:MAG: hypothetical protein UT36_C0005G0048 [Candidatus Peregrinibacteria bacterium GW2011_GWF2_39_17]KKR26814.1 MAG: hypothetical protein UT55_C0001G0025 [Candidatus Peregrinibacteria bacterium GW2011_GWE2_39_6]HCW32884.1 hypothetical protein [Candidatus Peregrinibacteria bacterium]